MWLPPYISMSEILSEFHQKWETEHGLFQVKISNFITNSKNVSIHRKCIVGNDIDLVSIENFKMLNVACFLDYCCII